MKARISVLGAFIVVGVVVPAGEAKDAVKPGFYGAIESVKKSADVEFHVKGNAKVSDLALSCFPVDPAITQATGRAYLYVVPHGALHVKSGALRYSGAADVKTDVTKPAIAKTTLSLTLRHVTGPTIHYSYEGNALTAVTAWKGTVRAPACTKAGVGSVTLFGPVKGE